MKTINILTHPVLVLSLFCLTLISGESFGGFYLVYILMALPHGGIHAVFALIGAGLILFSYGRYKRQSKYFIDPLLNILGVFSLYASLFVFFINSWSYNDQTFEQTVPVISFALFGVISLGFLIYSVMRFARPKSDKLMSLLS